jgi:hypothetical protein
MDRHPGKAAIDEIWMIRRTPASTAASNSRTEPTTLRASISGQVRALKS